MGDWPAAMAMLVAEGFLSTMPTDPINTGYATHHSKCYQYATYTSVSSQFRTCSTVLAPGVAGDIAMNLYSYVIMFSSETQGFNFPYHAWNNTSPTSRPYEYCILGPLK